MWTREELINAILEEKWLQDANRSIKKRKTKGLFTREAKERGYDDVQAYARDVLAGKASGNKKRAAFAKAMGTIARNR
jgi:hypothetical protein